MYGVAREGGTSLIHIRPPRFARLEPSRTTLRGHECAMVWRQWRWQQCYGHLAGDKDAFIQDALIQCVCRDMLRRRWTVVPGRYVS